MYDWSALFHDLTTFGFSFQLLLKGCTIEAMPRPRRFVAVVRFSCCWKDVRLKRAAHQRKSRPTCVSVVVERMYDWSGIINTHLTNRLPVSVVVERMYDWSARNPRRRRRQEVSVVVERMYDWSNFVASVSKRFRFQLLLKGCTIEASYGFRRWRTGNVFQLLLKGCTIEALMRMRMALSPR